MAQRTFLPNRIIHVAGAIRISGDARANAHEDVGHIMRTPACHVPHNGTRKIEKRLRAINGSSTKHRAGFASSNSRHGTRVESYRRAAGGTRERPYQLC